MSAQPDNLEVAGNAEFFEPEPIRPRRAYKGPAVIVLMPTVGRIVHWQPFHKAEPMAAIITAVHHDEPVPEHGVPYVDLTIFTDDGQTARQAPASWSDTPAEGHWNWPTRS